ncbi:mitochondrial mRNA pseudouridine synthase RPUSD3 [Ascaphus truei]|uniref:mitochondrial mRNA pseudouridine synthase RPUSD3 n=1 Tax=Ascaphus truei TaxID=8439 RepID=UPI003F5A4A4C
MNLLCRLFPVVSRSWLAMPELPSHTVSGYLASVRTKNTLARYRTRQQPKDQEIRSSFGARQERVSILRDPGVVTVGKLTREKLCELLVQSVVYMKGPLVAINKPQGLSIAGKQEEVTLLSLLYELRESLGLSHELHVVKAAPKESSGLVLLSGCHTTTKHMEEFYARCRKTPMPVATYWAVTVGVPDPPEGEIKMALKVERIGDTDLVVPVMDPSKGSLERREVKKTETRYEVLDVADGCALVQLQPMSIFQAQILVHATLKFCPVLGDHIYSARVGKLLGEDIYVPVDIALPQAQLLEDKILRRMLFTQQQMHRMPLHLHLHQLLMPCDSAGQDLHLLTAPPPPFFLRTIQLLGLDTTKVQQDRTKDIPLFRTAAKKPSY